MAGCVCMHISYEGRAYTDLSAEAEELSMRMRLSTAEVRLGAV